MARARTGGGGAGYAIALVLFGAGFFICLLLAIVFWTQLSGARQQAADATARLSRWATPNEEGNPALTNLTTPITRTLLQENQQLKTMLVGDNTATLEQIAAAMGPERANVQGAAIRAITDLRRELEDKQNQITGLERSRADVEARATRSLEDLEKVQASYEQSIQAIQGEVQRLAQAFADYQGRGQQMERDLLATFDTDRQAWAGERQGLEQQVQRLDLDRRNIQRLLEELSRQNSEGVSRINAADAVITAILPEGDQVYVSRGSNDKLQLGMTFEIFDKGELVRLDEEGGAGATRGKATVEIIELRPDSSRARVVRQTRGTRLDDGDQLINVVYDPNRTQRFFVYGDFDIDNRGEASVTERRRVENMITNWGGRLAENLSYDVDFLVLGQEPPLPQQPPPNVIDPTVIAEFVAARQNFERYQQLIGQARELNIPILNQNRFLNLVGYYQR